MVEVPALVRSKALVAGAEDWLADLDDLVAELADRWSLTLGEVFGDGTEALVVAVDRADGTPAVLKVLVPRGTDDATHEATALRHADGDGCARLLEADPGRGALLLERLGPSLHDLGVPYRDRLVVLADVAARVWKPAAGLGLPTGAEKAKWLARHIVDAWEASGRPCSEAVVEHALACAERRRDAHLDERAVLVHGDVHQWNALRRGDGWALVDPDGILAEPEYDLGVLLREDPEELLAAGPWSVAEELAGRTGLDALAAWEWGVVERVSTGVLCERIGLQPFGRQTLAAAEVLAGPGPWPSPPGGRRRRRDQPVDPVDVRPATAEDLGFLEQMLAVAADWRPGSVPRPVAEVMADPGVAHYVAGWPRDGDAGVVAEGPDGSPLGAAWLRLLTAEDPGYGYVADDVPEVAVGVVADGRGHGIGQRLLAALAEQARRDGLARLSLSVEVDNPATRLYERLGWVTLSKSDGAATMVLELGVRP